MTDEQQVHLFFYFTCACHVLPFVCFFSVSISFFFLFSFLFSFSLLSSDLWLNTSLCERLCGCAGACAYIPGREKEEEIQYNGENYRLGKKKAGKINSCNLCSLDASLVIGCEEFKGIWPVAGRYFLTAKTQETYPDGTFLACGQSISDHPLCPDLPKYGHSEQFVEQHRTFCQ